MSTPMSELTALNAIAHGQSGESVTPSAAVVVDVSTSTAILAANASRKGCVITCVTTGPITVNVAGTTAVALTGVLLAAKGSRYEMSRNLGNNVVGSITAIGTTTGDSVSVIQFQ